MTAIYEPEHDLALEEVITEIRTRDPRGEIWGTVFRHTYDMIYNGQETGRYTWSQLMKTEKTHFGTLFEINAQRAFGFAGGDSTDYRISGHQVDAKWSQSPGGWMLPPEVFGELALVATASDVNSVWSLGLIRIEQMYRSEGANRDKKSQLNALGRSSVSWIWKDEALRPNILLQLPQVTVDHILDSPFGTQRTHRLFREAEGMVVHRNVVATVSRQLDHQKRVRYNGGSRSALRSEGFLILSGAYHRELISSFGLPTLRRDEYTSVRVVPSSNTEGAVIEGRRWRRALAHERIVEAAPIISEPRSA